MFISTKVKAIIGLKCAVFLQDKTELISLIPDKSGNLFLPVFGTKDWNG